GEGDIGAPRSCAARGCRHIRHSDRAGRHERRCVGAEVDIAGTEVAVLQPDIDIRTNREANAGNALVSEGAVAVVVGKGVDARVANTAASVKGNAVRVAEVEQAVDHARPDINAIAKVERGKVPIREYAHRSLCSAAGVEG